MAPLSKTNPHSSVRNIICDKHIRVEPIGTPRRVGDKWEVNGYIWDCINRCWNQFPSVIYCREFEMEDEPI